MVVLNENQEIGYINTLSLHDALPISKAEWKSN